MEYRRGRPDEPSQLGTEVCATKGDVLIDKVLSSADGLSVWSAMFKPGACTFWHSHERGQLFIIGAGKGMIATRDGKAQVVGAGDVVHAPPGEEHWHGAAPDAFVTYTSVSLGKTTFAEEVSQEQYLSRWE